MVLGGFVPADVLFFDDGGAGSKDQPAISSTGAAVHPIVDMNASIARAEAAAERAGVPSTPTGQATGGGAGGSAGGSAGGGGGLSIRKSLELTRAKKEDRVQGQGFGDDFVSFGANTPTDKSKTAEGGSASKGDKMAMDPAPPTDGMLRSTAGFEVNKKSPWSRGQAYNTRSSDKMVDLHMEILDFVSFIKPTKAEVKRRETLVDFMRQVCADLWPESELHVFGSYATGMFLPSSDVDMAAIGCNESPVTALNRLARVLRNDGNFDKIQVIAKAKVPIIKWDDRESGIALNICINQKDGIANTQWVLAKKAEIDPLEPILLVLKQFLYNRDLHETFTGGWGSYLLTMTIISHLQHHPGQGPDHTKAETNLGALLIDYLHLYGLRFNMERIGISVRDGGSFFQKRSQGWADATRPFLLSVEDPKNPASDLARNSFNVRNVQRAFE
ncbi:hypothetical protein T484DRAFT_2560553 [Baffinella frigidus]|nr:hypothetical protein T484DRAFT_2560553 [Cryptophyta sp. CCMP2293]